MVNKIWKSTWTYVVIVLILIGAFYGYKSITGRAVVAGEYDEFAQCLTDAGLKMYGTDWCKYCKQQKEMFWDSFQYIDYINCDDERDVCLVEGINGYPTWKINGESYAGVQQLGRLAQLSGCEL